MTVYPKHAEIQHVQMVAVKGASKHNVLLNMIAYAVEHKVVVNIRFNTKEYLVDYRKLLDFVLTQNDGQQ